MTRWNNDEARKRKESIVTAMTSLLREKSLSEISVSDLCEACGITRQAFYYHFDSLEDMFLWSIKVNIRSDNGRPSFIGGICDVCEAFLSRKELTMAFLSSVYRERLLSTIRSDFETKAREFVDKNIRRDIPDEIWKYIVMFLTNMSLGLIRDWIDDGMKVEVPDIRRTLTELFRIAIRSDIKTE